jgi:hypothetical protein
MYKRGMGEMSFFGDFFRRAARVEQGVRTSGHLNGNIIVSKINQLTSNLKKKYIK